MIKAIKAIDQKIEMINGAEIYQSGEFDPWCRIDQGEKMNQGERIDQEESIDWGGTYHCCEKDQWDVIDQWGDIY